MKMNHGEIKEQEALMILQVIGMLEFQAQKIEGIMRVTEDSMQRQGQQDALDLIRESIETAKSITAADIARSLERSQESVAGLPALLACGSSGRRD
jgi:hypothetical protein